MNTNIIRTALTWAAIVIPLLATFFGCAADAVSGAVNCSASWLPPQYAVLLSSGLLVVNQVVKAFDGTGLFKPVSK